MQSFELGLTYWPRHAAFQLWEASDRGAIRDELAHIVTLGFQQIRLCLLWEAFQPGSQRIGSIAFRSLEQLLDLAHEAGLKVVPVLFPVAIAGALMLPDWANGVSLIEELAEGDLDDLLPRPNNVNIVSAASYRLNQAPDLFSYRPILRAQRYLIQELVGYFGTHPVIRAWQLGEGLEYVHAPTRVNTVQRWYASMADAVRAQRPKAYTIAMLSARGLTQSQGPGPAHANANCDALAISAAPPEPEHAVRRTDYPVFLHHLASALAERHVLVSDLGLPSTTVTGGEWRISSHAGQNGPVFFGDPEQQASYLEVALARLLQAGVAGVWLPAYSDYGQAHWNAAPLDRSLHSRSQGLVDISGREKPAAQAVQTFAKRLAQAADIAVQPGDQQAVPLEEPQRPDQANSVPVPGDIDPERYWRDPAGEFMRLWGEWVAR